MLSLPQEGAESQALRKVEDPVTEKESEDPKLIRQIHILRLIHIRFSDLTIDDNDPFVRYWIKVYKNQRSGDGIDFEGKMRESLSTLELMQIQQLTEFLDANLDLEYVYGLGVKMVVDQP